jgi:hypothetical protein
MQGQEQMCTRRLFPVQRQEPYAQEDRKDMSEHNMKEHKAGATPNKEAGISEGLSRILRSRSFVIGVTIAVLLVGLLLARRFGIGGRVVLGVGLATLMMVGRSCMHRGHGAHGGCGASSRQRLQTEPTQLEDPKNSPRNGREVDTPYSPRGHSSCH